MGMVSIGSTKASPGTTTLALALALAQADAPQLVVEADPDGGSIAARLGLGYEPGLVELAAASRRDRPETSVIARYLQLVADQVSVLCGPASTAQAHAALSLSAGALAAGLASVSDASVLVDVGRINGRSAALEFVRRSTITLLVCRPRLDEIQHLRAAVELLERAGARPALVSVGRHPYDPEEIADRVGAELFGVWVDDVDRAEAFWARPAARSRSESKSLWWRTTVDLAQQLAVESTPSLQPLPNPAEEASEHELTESTS